MKFSENRPLARIVCIACALVAVFGFGGAKLKGRYSSVEDAFLHGVDVREGDNNHNMEHYLDRAAQAASDLAYESMQYLGEGEQDLAKDLASLAGELSAVSGPAEKRGETWNRMNTSAEQVYSALQKAGKHTESAVTKAYGDLQSARDLLKRDGYYAYAEDYNRTASGFPAGMISSLWGIGEADTFGN